MESFSAIDADVFCIQETKLQEGQHEVVMEGYGEYWHYAEKKGYSGTATFSKEPPLGKAFGIGKEAHDKEGRVLTLE